MRGVASDGGSECHRYELSTVDKKEVQKRKKKVKTELGMIAENFGGPSKLSVHPQLASPFNERKGYEGGSNLPGGGAYQIDQKEILSASVNLDYITRMPPIVSKGQPNKNRISINFASMLGKKSSSMAKSPIEI